jgi:ABC-type uncharacterized transport system ATPase subunit
MRGVTKHFGPVQALRGAGLSCESGAVHALLGENGAGKSTLMHVLYGMTRPDEGEVCIDGASVRLRSPGDARRLGIGMVHQHFTQVPRMSVAQNVWLGRPGLVFDADAAGAAIRRIAADTGLALEPGALAGELPVGLRQRLEIVKALAGRARVLILDEPTGALAPGEVDQLFAALKRMRDAGLAIVLITHKLREARAIADRVTVLRRGEVTLAGPAASCDEASLAAAMLGGPGTPPVRKERTPLRPGAAPALVARSVSVVGGKGEPDRVRGVSFSIMQGEVVGIAAVEGNGQRELLRAVAGLIPCRGEISIGGRVGFVPEDRQEEGLVLEMSLAENLALAERGGWRMDRAAQERRAAEVIAAFGIAGTPRQPAGTLSGGNQQKVVLARALGCRPALLVAENPTRGLDVGATADLHRRLREAARGGTCGVLYHSTDLDEVLEVSDRVAVMADGRWIEVPEGMASRDYVGSLMLGRAA